MKHKLRYLRIIFPLFLLLGLVFAFNPTPVHADSVDLYWIGGTGVWTDTAHWATDAGGGGAGHAAPTSSNNVFFTSSSSGATYTVTINAAPANCNDITVAQPATGIVQFTYSASNYLYVYGSMTLVAGMTYNDLTTYFKSTASGKTITTNGVATVNANFNGVGGEWTLQDNSTFEAISIDNGNFITGNRNITTSSFYISGASSSATLGSSTINTGDWAVLSGGTVSAGTSTIIDTSTTNNDFRGGSQTYNNVTINVGSQTTDLDGTNTFASLTVNGGTASATDNFEVNANQTVTGTLTLSGYSSSYRLPFFSNTLHTQRTISAGTVTVSNTLFRDIVGSGAGNWNLSARTDIGDCGGNTGITFPASIDVFAVNGFGNYNWSVSTKWASTSGGVGGSGRVPLPQDIAIYDENSFTIAGVIVTFDVSNLPGINTVDVTNNPQFNATTAYFYNSMHLGTCLWNVTSATYMLGQTGQTFSGDYSFGSGAFYIDVQGGSINQSGALVTGGTIYLTSGIWATNDYAVTAKAFDSSTNTYARALWMDASVFTLNSTAAAIKWNVNATNMNVDCLTSTIVFTNTGANTSQFTGGGKTYYNLVICGSGSYTTQFNDANTFNNITVIRSNADYLNNGATLAAAKTISGNFTQTIQHFYSPLYGVTTTTITNVDFSKSSGLVTSDYLVISGSDASGGATFLAGSHSTDTNTGDLLTNGNMETGSPPTGWTGYNQTIASVASPVHGGSKALSSTKVTPGYAYQDIASYATYKGKKLTFGCWINAPAGVTAKLEILDGVGDTIITVPSDGTYHYSTVTLTESNSATLLRCDFYGETVGTAIFGDDATLTASTNTGWSFTDAVAPTISAASATLTTRTTAVLNGGLDSLGSYTAEGVYISFQYDKTGAYTLPDMEETAETLYTSTGTKSAGVASLDPDTTYHFRMVARYNGTSYLYATDTTFLTLGSPVVTTQNPSDITDTTATLHGTVTDMGEYATVFAYFQYGATTSYGSVTPEQEFDAEAAFEQDIGGLTLNNTYHYRAVVRYNATSYAYGNDISFQAGAAIGNPASMSWGYYKVWYDVLEAGDMLFTAEGKVMYGTDPTDYAASEAYTFEIWNTAGTSILLTTPLANYGDRPIGIYCSASKVTSLSLSTGTAYIMKISGNPLIFSSETGNTIVHTLTATDYVDQDLGNDNNVPTNNNLRNGMIVVAQHMEATDSPTTSYMVSVDGYKYLGTTGGALFMEGINGLQIMCPILFQSGITAIDSSVTSTGTYASTLSAGAKWGATAANGLTMLGTWLGISQPLAGSVVLFALVIMLAVFIYQKTESGIVVILMVSACPFIGAYLGLMPMALAFIFVIIIITLLGYFFVSRGAL